MAKLTPKPFILVAPKLRLGLGGLGVSELRFYTYSEAFYISAKLCLAFINGWNSHL
jgi:hypothetical protein